MARIKRSRDKTRLAFIVGARPNLVKAAPILAALADQRGVEVLLVHTGQHYDDAMSGVFLRQLGIRKPDAHLKVGAGSHAVQTARIMSRFEALLQERPIDRVLVVGDVNSTLATTLVAAKLCIPVDHVEAGLRSGDRRMPEEINRIVTDSLADRFFVSEPSGVDNLLREGHGRTTIHLVGNVMIDSLLRLLPAAEKRRAWLDFGLKEHSYAVATLHRPSNVDDEATLANLIEVLRKIGREIPVVFPVHPRTRRRLRGVKSGNGLTLAPPQGYLEFQSLMSHSRLVITDSGGVQEETTALGIPCLTLRETTERPVTVTMGTNTLIGGDLERLGTCVSDILEGRYKKGVRPQLWDGNAARRIAAVLVGSDVDGNGIR